MTYETAVVKTLFQNFYRINSLTNSLYHQYFWSQRRIGKTSHIIVRSNLRLSLNCEIRGKTIFLGAREVIQHFRVLDILAEVPSLVPSVLVRWLTFALSSIPANLTLSSVLHKDLHTCTHTHTIGKIKN